MKNFFPRFIFPLLLTFPCIVFAADWDLFPWMQQNIYTTPWHESKYLAFSYQFDSVKIDGDTEAQQFNQKLYGVNDPYCLNHLSFPDEGYSYTDYYGMDSIVAIDNIVFIVITDDNGSTIDTFIFYPFASINDSWTMATPNSYANFDSIRITCSSVAEELIFGFTDSVKTFTIQAYNNSSTVSTFDNNKIRLSKENGLLEFIPFKQFFIQYSGNLIINPMKLIGTSADGASNGFSTPKFEDYFDYQAGSILKWHHTNTPGGAAPTEDIWRDSIKQVISSSDSVKIIFDRTVQHIYSGDSTLAYEYDLSATVHNYNNRYIGLPIRRLSIGSIEFADATNWGSGGAEYLWNVFLAVIDSADASYPVFEYSASTDLLIDTADCILYDIYELQGNYSFTINDKAGFVKVSRQYLNLPYIGFDYFVLTGYVIGTDSSGDYFPIGIHEITPSNIFSVIPTLAADKISITFSSPNAAFEASIFDVQGRLVIREEVKSGASLDIENLGSGLYFVLVKSDAATGTARFVKK